jgi:hypothetical protein
VIQVARRTLLLIEPNEPWFLFRVRSPSAWL